jgi:hypothetical protein
MKKSLNEYASDITSQFGEDGIIQELFQRLGVEVGTCVEFGAWDGKHYSNTWTLWHNKGWRAVLIEGDESKAKELAANTASFPNVCVHQAYVVDKGDNALDSMLKRLNISNDIDLLSIDIDGNDYYIFESLELYQPRVVVVEINPTIPPYLELIGPKDTKIGSSALSLCKLAYRKGYRLVACTETNLFFVLDQDFNKLDIIEPSLCEVMPTVNLTYIMNSYDGKMFINRLPTYSSAEEMDIMVFFKWSIKIIIKKILGLHRLQPPSSDGMIQIRVVRD